MSVTKLCRLCSENSSKNAMVPLDVLDYGRIKCIFPEILNDDFLLPKESCSACKTQLELFSNFRDQVLAADSKLRNLLGQEDLVLTDKPTIKDCSAFICPHCSLEYKSRNGLRQHLKELHFGHVNRRRYHCRYCSQDFKSTLDRKTHEHCHEGEKPFLCDICGISFRHSTNLRLHMVTHSVDRKRFPCEICNKTFLTRGMLREHCNMHTGARPYTCSVCGKGFPGRGHLRQHRWSHAGKPFSCDLCGRTFSRKSNMAAHIKEFHLRNSDKAIDSSSKIDVTQDLPVESNSGFSCRKCKTQFEDAATLKSHLASHVDVTECNLCGKVFMHHGSLTYHRRVAHTGERPFKCSHCNLSFPLRSLAANHERRVHTGQAPFTCSHCNRCFVSAAALKYHTLSHSNECKFTCELCGKAFKRRNALAVHLKVHLEDKPFKCSVCAKGFTQKANSTRHEKMHSAESKPFFCKFCGDSFGKRTDLMKHSQCRKKLLQSNDFEPNDIDAAEEVLDLVIKTEFSE